VALKSNEKGAPHFSRASAGVMDTVQKVLDKDRKEGHNLRGKEGGKALQRRRRRGQEKPAIWSEKVEAGIALGGNPQLASHKKGGASGSWKQ